jgi:dTDP-4-dehydrorhamnose reductase
MGSARVLVTGANGFLGQSLIRSLLNQSFEVIASGKAESRFLLNRPLSCKYYSLDLRDNKGFENLFSETAPDIVVHAGAMTQVDQCELSRQDCYNINVLATKTILNLAERKSSFFLFMSTDFVFDGVEGNYVEEDELSPVNWYGNTKVEAELMVRQSDLPWSIVRTCLVYGPSAQGMRQNIITWVHTQLKKGEAIRVVDDQIRTPTYVEDLVKGIVRIIESASIGIFHVSGEEILTPYQMALKTATYCGLDTSKIERVTAADFTQAAKRPAKTGFKIDKAKSALGFLPHSFDQALAKIFSQ